MFHSASSKGHMLYNGYINLTGDMEVVHITAISFQFRYWLGHFYFPTKNDHLTGKWFKSVILGHLYWIYNKKKATAKDGKSIGTIFTITTVVK